MKRILSLMLVICLLIIPANIAYANDQKLTSGVSATEFGTSSASAQMYTTFVLRALGYSDAEGVFTWSQLFDLAEKTGIDTSAIDIAGFLRVDVANMSFNALNAKMKYVKKLSEKLIKEGVFTSDKYEASQKFFIPADENDLIKIGDKEVNAYLLSIGGKYMNNYNECICFDDPSMYGKILSYLDSKADKFVTITHEGEASRWWDGYWQRIDSQMSSKVFVEIMDVQYVHQVGHSVYYRVTLVDSAKNIQKGREFYLINTPYYAGNEQESEILVGSKEINEYLMSLNPVSASQAGNLDGTLYHLIWEGHDIYPVLKDYFNRNSKLKKNGYYGLEYVYSGVPNKIVRVEIIKRKDGSTNYSMELFYGDGGFEYIDYTLK